MIPDMKTDAERPELRCSRCRDPIDECECCERPECRSAVCYQCMVVDLREAVTAIHEHGG